MSLQAAANAARCSVPNIDCAVAAAGDNCLTVGGADRDIDPTGVPQRRHKLLARRQIVEADAGAAARSSQGFTIRGDGDGELVCVLQSDSAFLLSRASIPNAYETVAVARHQRFSVRCKCQTPESIPAVFHILCTSNNQLPRLLAAGQVDNVDAVLESPTRAAGR